MTQPLTIRTYRTADRDAVLELFDSGMLMGHIDPIEGTADIEDVEKHYLRRPSDHFWVAESDGRVVGMIAVALDDEGVAHIRRLRVLPSLQRTDLAAELVDTTVKHARNNDVLKIVLHTPVDEARAMELLEHLGFNYAGTREVRGRHLLEFYLNLYERPHANWQELEGTWRLA